MFAAYNNIVTTLPKHGKLYIKNLYIFFASAAISHYSLSHNVDVAFS